MTTFDFMDLFHQRHLFLLSWILIVSIILDIFWVTPSHALNLISKETELSMGRGADKQVSKQYGIYQDKTLQLYINEVGQDLVNHLSDQVFSRFFFKVMDSYEINAFALPGGYIYVTRGILALLNNEAELAAVLGHEIGHVIFHHSAKHITRNIGAQILSIGGVIASPKNAGQWLMISSQLFQQMNLGYGREAELESDAQGIVNAYESGYNPKSMGAFLRSLRRQEIMSGQSYHSFHATHPETKDRIIRADSMGTSLKSRSEGPVLNNREVYLKQLKGLPYGGKRHSQDLTRHYKPMHIDIYQVRKGDTFKSIAENTPHLDSRALEIATMNGLRPDDVLTPGQLLKVVKKGIYEPKKYLFLESENIPKSTFSRRGRGRR